MFYLFCRQTGQWVALDKNQEIWLTQKVYAEKFSHEDAMRLQGELEEEEWYVELVPAR